MSIVSRCSEAHVTPRSFFFVPESGITNFMPELPEVETITQDLKKVVVGKTFVAVWTDWPRHFMFSPGGFSYLKKNILQCKIVSVSRHGKYIVFDIISAQTRQPN